MKTVGQLKEEIRRQVWPSGEAENLKGPQPDGSMGGHDLIFQEGMAEISKWVTCERESNVDVVAFCKTNFKCGMTILDAPHGEIRRLFAVVGDDFCDPVIYREVDWPAPECFGRSLLPYVGQAPSFPARFPLGFTSADAANDGKCGRARTGIWCKHKGNIYIAPWIQSVEKVVFEWDGIKKEWSDDDLINDDQDYKKALKLYFQYGHERDYGSPQMAQAIHNIGKTGTFDEALADLIWACNERRKVRETKECLPELNRIGTTLVELGLPVEAPGPVVMGHIGNIASGNALESSVAALVGRIGPSVLLVSGVNSSGSYDTNVGADYHSFISPYAGVHGDGAESNALWPTPGDSDWGDSLVAYLAFFQGLPGNQRYYDVCLGLVHFFFLDTNSSEPDGNLESSIQAEWLKARMALSTAPWKVVVMAAAPYSSVIPSADLRWPFKDWGANLILSGAPTRYERLRLGGLDYIVNGQGGLPVASTSDPPTAGSQYFRTANDGGAGRLTITAETLAYEFLDLTDAVLDTLTISK